MGPAMDVRQGTANERQRLLEWLALVLFASHWALLLTRLVRSPVELELWRWTITLFAAYLAADLLSGLVHCLADRCGSIHTPLLGPALIRPFREHHAYPQAICHHDFVELNGNTALLGLPLLAPTAWLLPTETLLGAAFAIFALTLSVAVLLTNSFHSWAHADSPPRLVRALQRARLILSPEHHDHHHEPPFSRCYCVTVGWLDPLLDLFVRRPDRGTTSGPAD